MQEKKVLILRCCKNDFTQIVDNGVRFRYLEVKKYWECGSYQLLSLSV